MGRERLGKYKLKETIGLGSFGKVKRATNTATNGVVAVKIMNKKKLRKQQGLVELVRQEVAHMKLLPAHDHIITLLEVLESDTHIYLVMECATNGELYQRVLSDGAFSDEQARNYWRQLLAGLEYVHSQKICHRDLKLENLLLDPNDTLKISDFGLSVLRQEYHNHKELMAIAGTPNYIAPEIIAGRGYDGFKADIWSAGVCLYGILAGYLPFDTGKDVKKLFKLISQGEVKYPERFHNDAVDLLTGILQTNPAERFTLRDCIAHRWTNDGHELDPSHADSMQEIVHFEPSEIEIMEAVKEIKTPSPLPTPIDGDDRERFNSNESFEEDLDDFIISLDPMSPRSPDAAPGMFPARSREQRTSSGKSLSDASTHPSNGDLSADLKTLPSLSGDDYEDSDAEEIPDDLSTDFTDSEEESESSHSKVAAPAIQNAFTLLAVVNDHAFTSLLSKRESKQQKVQSVITCFHSDLRAAPLLEVLASCCRSMDYVRLKVYPPKFLIKLQKKPPHQKTLRVNIEIKEANGNTVVECHRLKGTISNYQEWYDKFMYRYNELSKKHSNCKEKVTPPTILNA